MGALYDFFNLLYPENSEYPAMEAAEDITKEVENETDEIVEGDDDGSDGEINTNTDDILGTKSTNNTSNENENSEEESESSSDENGENEDFSDDEDMDISEENSESSEDIQEIKKKQLLHKNFNYLYDIIDSNISIVANYSPNTLDENVIHALASAKERLEECKQLISSTLKDDFKTSSYATLIKRYVGVNRVYDLIIEMVKRALPDTNEVLDKKSNNKK